MFVKNKLFLILFSAKLHSFQQHHTFLTNNGQGRPWILASEVRRRLHCPANSLTMSQNRFLVFWELQTCINHYLSLLWTSDKQFTSWKSLSQGKWKFPEFPVKAKAITIRTMSFVYRSLSSSEATLTGKQNRAIFFDSPTIPSLTAMSFTHRELRWTTDNDIAKQRQQRQQRSKGQSWANREVCVKKRWGQNRNKFARENLSSIIQTLNDLLHPLEIPKSQCSKNSQSTNYDKPNIIP